MAYDDIPDVPPVTANEVGFSSAAAGALGASRGLQGLMAARLLRDKMAQAQANWEREQAVREQASRNDERRLNQADQRETDLLARLERSGREADQQKLLGQVTQFPGARVTGTQLESMGVGKDSPLRGTQFKNLEEALGGKFLTGMSGTAGTPQQAQGQIAETPHAAVGPDTYEVKPTFTEEMKTQGQALAELRAQITQQLGEAKNENERQHWQNMLDTANMKAAVAEGKAGQKDDDAQAIADAITRGEQPPDLSRLYGAGASVRASLARKGYNLTKATEDWQATSKYLATLNGQQQTRIRQAVDFTDESLGKVQELAQQWKSSGLGPLSRAALTAATQGAAGSNAQSLATRFQAQIADVTSELATVYKGGNSSTDESLALAAKNLQADWSEKALLDNIQQIRQNLGYRRNSLRSAGVAGASADNPYAPSSSPPTTSAPAGGTGGGPAVGTQRTINGTPAVWDGHGWVAR